nr:MAG TPA: cell division control protein 13 [Caudoviricetes sp.]
MDHRPHINCCEVYLWTSQFTEITTPFMGR